MSDYVPDAVITCASFCAGAISLVQPIYLVFAGGGIAAYCIYKHGYNFWYWWWYSKCYVSYGSPDFYNICKYLNGKLDYFSRSYCKITFPGQQQMTYNIPTDGTSFWINTSNDSNSKKWIHFTNENNTFILQADTSQDIEDFLKKIN